LFSVSFFEVSVVEVRRAFAKTGSGHAQGKLNNRETGRIFFPEQMSARRRRRTRRLL